MRGPAILGSICLAACGGGGGGGHDGPPGSDASGDGGLPPSCDAPATFADGLTPARVLHVEAGAPPGGDGSPGAPFDKIQAAAAAATPGTAIRLGPGVHLAGQYVDMLRGTEGAPIWIGGEPGVTPVPIVEGGGEALHLTRPRYVVIHDLEVRLPSDNGINIDDGGDYGDPTAAHHVALVRLYVHDVGGTGNQDCVKISGLTALTLYDSRIERCGGAGSGSGIDFVGGHDSVVARNAFVSMSGNAVQAKGGSTDIDVRQNVMRDAGLRAVNLGGSTGFEFFRPPLSMAQPNAEARRIRAYDNVVIGGGDTPFAFVGCTDCLVAHNLVSGNPRWLIRILQETVTQSGYTFDPARDGKVIDNSFVFQAVALSTTVNIGPDTMPATFTFSHNLWYAADDPSRSAPDLPVAEDGGIVGLRSGYVVLPGPPYFSTQLCRDANESMRGVALPDVPGTFDGRCRDAPTSIGPLESISCTE